MKQDSRLSAARTLLEHIRDTASFDLVFQLWDGSTVPVDADGDALRLVIADAGALGRLVRRPRIDTAVELWCDKRIDVHNGNLFDLAANRPQGKGSKIFKRLSKAKLLKSAWPFLRAGDKADGSEREDLAGRKAQASGSTAEAIRHHYDVSNAFYRLFLDQRMIYSCAYFTDWANDIDQAQVDKLDMICRKLRLKPGERFLDIGSGWGALVIHAAEHYGVTAHGVTLSNEQFALANERIAAKGLQDRITIELKPFQELTGQFDKIASIGMFEHVGFAHHAEYFRKVNQLLRPRGLYLHHAITRRAKATDKAFKKRPPEYKALVKFIFPGGELDYVGWSAKMLEAHGFEVHDVENWREHYARTCRLWAERLEAHFPAAIEQVGEARARLWLLYLTGCALTFERSGALIFQTLASKRDKGPSGLPSTRADLYQ